MSGWLLSDVLAMPLWYSCGIQSDAGRGPGGHLFCEQWSRSDGRWSICFCGIDKSAALAFSIHPLYHSARRRKKKLLLVSPQRLKLTILREDWLLHANGSTFNLSLCWQKRRHAQRLRSRRSRKCAYVAEEATFVRPVRKFPLAHLLPFWAFCMTLLEKLEKTFWSVSGCYLITKLWHRPCSGQCLADSRAGLGRRLTGDRKAPGRYG